MGNEQAIEVYYDEVSKKLRERRRSDLVRDMAHDGRRGRRELVAVPAWIRLLARLNEDGPVCFHLLGRSERSVLKRLTAAGCASERDDLHEDGDLARFVSITEAGCEALRRGLREIEDFVRGED